MDKQITVTLTHEECVELLLALRDRILEMKISTLPEYHFDRMAFMENLFARFYGAYHGR